jgi:serine/threonine protein kinase
MGCSQSAPVALDAAPAHPPRSEMYDDEKDMRSVRLLTSMTVRADTDRSTQQGSAVSPFSTAPSDSAGHARGSALRTSSFALSAVGNTSAVSSTFYDERVPVSADDDCEECAPGAERDSPGGANVMAAVAVSGAAGAHVQAAAPGVAGAIKAAVHAAIAAEVAAPVPSESDAPFWLHEGEWEAHGRSFASEWDTIGYLGRGQFGVVHTCRNRVTGTLAAAKQIDKSKCRRSLFEAEVAAMTAVRSHPGVVSLIGVYESAALLIVLMEVVQGGELFDRLVQEGAYSERTARELMRCAVEALAFIHARGIVHRDIKPENILLVSKDVHDGRLKIADFGLCRALSPEAAPLTAICGTWAYSTPEMRATGPRGNKVGYGLPVDVWALGVVCYIVLCGYHPFDPLGDGTQAVIASAIAEGSFSMDGEEWKSVSEAAKSAVRGMLTVDPAARLTAAQVLAHPWMRSSALPEEPLSRDIGANIDVYRRRMAAKLKAAGIMAIAAVRLSGGGARRWSLPSASGGASLATAVALTAPAEFGGVHAASGARSPSPRKGISHVPTLVSIHEGDEEGDSLGEDRATPRNRRASTGDANAAGRSRWVALRSGKTNAEGDGGAAGAPSLPGTC